MRVGVVGLGDMGSGLAKNLIKAGFETSGYDLIAAKNDRLSAMGGNALKSSADVGANSDALYVMVMNGDEVKEVLFGPRGTNDGALARMGEGAAVVLTATIKPSEAIEIAAMMEGSGIHLIDSPVSGGYPGAQGGTLTMMPAAPAAVLDHFAPVMEAVSGTIHRVGTEPGQGQTVKACLQSLLGSIFSATFEMAALAAKAGVPGDVMHKVVSTSSGGCGITSGSLEKIIDRDFEGGGSGIRTMYKDLTISMDLAREMGVPLFTAAMAMQLFQAGKTKYPEADNWVATRITEEIIGAELHRDGGRAISDGITETKP